MLSTICSFPLGGDPVGDALKLFGDTVSELEKTLS